VLHELGLLLERGLKAGGIKPFPGRRRRGFLPLRLQVGSGLGALEASQVYALTAMGYTPAIGISLSLLMRARDILNGGLGLLLAGNFVRNIGR
jgi:hypothetical protein